MLHFPTVRKGLAILLGLGLSAITLAAKPAKAQTYTQDQYAAYYEPWVRQMNPKLGQAQAQTIARLLPYYVRVVIYYNKNLTDQEATYIAYHVLEKSYAFGVDARLIMGLISVESRFKPQAVSRAGARGLGQLMPGTAKYLGVGNSFDLEQNIYGTVKYIREQLDKFQGWERPLDFALAAYNAGPKAVERHKGIPPYRETINYVKKVRSIFDHLCSGCASQGSGYAFNKLTP